MTIINVKFIGFSAALSFNRSSVEEIEMLGEGKLLTVNLKLGGFLCSEKISPYSVYRYRSLLSQA